MRDGLYCRRAETLPYSSIFFLYLFAIIKTIHYLNCLNINNYRLWAECNEAMSIWNSSFLAIELVLTTI